MFSREFQSTCLAFRSPTGRTGKLTPKQVVRSAPISWREGERYAARVFTGLPAIMTWMAVASKWVRPGTGTEWWTIPRRTRIAVPPPTEGLSVQCQTYLASRKAWPELRNVSLKRQISTPCWLRKCSSSSFLPRTPSEFQQARRRALPRTVLLGRAAIFGHEENDGLQAARGRAVPVGREEMDVRSRRVSSTHAWRGRRSRRSEISSSGSVGTTRTGVVG